MAVADDRSTHATRERQAAVLRHYDRLATAEGRSRTRVAADAGMSYDQYARYVSGVAALRVDQVLSFAAALGVGARELWRALDPSIPWSAPEAVAHPGHEQPEGDDHGVVNSGKSLDWDFRTALLALAPADDPLVTDMLALAGRYDEKTERAFVELVANQVAARRSTPNGVSGPGERQRRRA